MHHTMQKNNTQKRELSIVSRLHRIFNGLTTYVGDVFFADSEVRVWTSLDSENNLQWHVYNYRTDRSATFDSEVEAIDWLEKSYHQKLDAGKKFWFLPGSSILGIINDPSEASR